MVTRARKLSEESKEKTVLPSLDSTDWRGTARSLKVFHHNLLKKTTKVCYILVANAKHQQQTMDINYGLFSSFQNISDKNREEYDLKKHQGQHIWKGNRLRVIVGKNKPRKTGWMASSTRPGRQEHEFGLRVRMPRCANLLPVAVATCSVLVS